MQVDKFLCDKTNYYYLSRQMKIAKFINNKLELKASVQVCRMQRQMSSELMRSACRYKYLFVSFLLSFRALV